MKSIDYKTVGTCSRMIHVEVDDQNKISAVRFDGGCSGNTKGICRLVQGRDADEVITLLEGTTCGPRPTSCPDQLAQALKALKNS